MTPDGKFSGTIAIMGWENLGNMGPLVEQTRNITVNFNPDMVKG